MNGKHSLLFMVAVIAAIFYFGGFGKTESPPRSVDACMRVCGYGLVDRTTARGECICRDRR